jgi:hypothetical protein
MSFIEIILNTQTIWQLGKNNLDSCGHLPSMLGANAGTQKPI